MEYEKDLKKILCKCQSEEKTLDEVKALTAKGNILEAIEDKDLGISIEALGLTLEDIDNPEYMHGIEEADHNIMEFAKKDLINLYRYVAHPSSGYGASNLGNDTRSFCRKVAIRTNTSLMRYVDILKLNGSNKGFGQGGSNIYSVFKFRGGVNCKHIWVKYSYNKKTKALVKAPRNQQPKMIDAGKVGNA